MRISGRLLLASLVLAPVGADDRSHGDGAESARGPRSQDSVAAIVKIHGFSFSPYVDSQDPNRGAVVSREQIRARLSILAPYTVWVRSFGSTRGLEFFPEEARALGLQVAAGAWIGRNAAQNSLEIANLIAAARAGHVDVAIVGSEALLRNDVSESELIAYITQVRQAIPAGIPVATADTYDRLLAHPAVVAAGDIVLPNIYPYWQGLSIDSAICALESAYQQVVAIAAGKPVTISETGWPSAGNSLGDAVPSPANAAAFFLRFISWATARNVPYWYFAALDETWKAEYEGPQGSHWGVFDKNGVLKAGMQPVFDGDRVPVECNGVPGGPGTPEIRFTYVPPMGTSDFLRGQVLHVALPDCRIVHYIRVAGGLWVKPTQAQPTVSCAADGSYSVAIVTGGNDTQATDIHAFVVPANYSPPILLGQPLFPPDLIATAVASLHVARTSDSIRGRVLDTDGRPLGGVVMTLSGSDTGDTLTRPDGRYSFPTLNGVGSRTVTASFPNYTLSPPARTFASGSGAQTGDFTAALMVTPRVRGDFDGDGIPDGLWHHRDGPLYLWFMDGRQKVGECSLTPGVVDPAWQIAATVDLDNDGRPDILWRHTTGWLFVWLMDGCVRTDQRYLTPSFVPPDWEIRAAGDFDRNGDADILWWHAGTGQLYVWQMDGTSMAEGRSLTPSAVPPEWQPVAAVDIDLDDQIDILWRHQPTGTLYVWFMTETDFRDGSYVNPAQVPLDWRVAAVGDYDRNASPDLIWQNDVTGELVIWFMNGVDRIGSQFLTPPQVPPAWRLMGPK